MSELDPTPADDIERLEAQIDELRDARDRSSIGRKERVGKGRGKVGRHATYGVATPPYAELPSRRAVDIPRTFDRYLLYFFLVNGIPLV